MKTTLSKRAPGRPAKSAGTGGYKPVLVTLYAEHLAAAKRIDANTSAAVRIALDYWTCMHPAQAQDQSDKTP